MPSSFYGGGFLFKYDYIYTTINFMEKKQLIEIICVIAGISLALKAVDYLQYFISALFQLLGEQGYVQWYYFFIYLFTLVAFIGIAILLVTRAKGISDEISKRLDPSDILIDLNSSRALEYALIIIGGITVITGLSNFLTNFITSLTIQEELAISGNLVWLYGLIKTLLGIIVIFLARPLSRMVGSEKEK